MDLQKDVKLNIRRRKSKREKGLADSGAAIKYKSVKTGVGSGKKEMTKVKVATTGFKKTQLGHGR